MTKKEHKKPNEENREIPGKETEEALLQEENLKKEAVEINNNKTINDEQLSDTPSQEAIQKEIKSREEELTQARKKTEEYLDHLQRLQAEFDNYRKREEKQRLNLKEKILEDVACDLLPVVDNFDRAITIASKPNTTLDSYHQGMELVFQQFLEKLKKMDVKPMETLGKDFNPHFHEAVMRKPSSDYQEGCVMEVLQKGWLLSEKVIRPAMVVVSAGADCASAENMDTVKEDTELKIDN
jgi:molecular chaperone GrpE